MNGEDGGPSPFSLVERRIEPFSEIPIYVGEEPRPDAEGAVLVLERIEKSAWALF